MLKSVLSLIFFFQLCSKLFSQADSVTVEHFHFNDGYVEPNIVYAELGGGLNYERVVLGKKHFMLTARVGLGNSISLRSSTYALSGNIGSGFNFFEFGLANMDYTQLGAGINDEKSHYSYPFLGYRYQRKFVFKFQVRGLSNHLTSQLFPNVRGLLLFCDLGFGRAF